jgi:hypothetical protein
MEDWACARMEEGVLGPGRWSTMAGTQIGREGQVDGGDIPVFRSGYTAGEKEASFAQKITRVWACY